jgi:xanthine dehydrogenase accessory factor
MTSDELRDLMHELHDRDEAYALITVVRVVAPTSAYTGAQAIVLADGALHGWIGGGCAKNVVIRAA